MSSNNSGRSSGSSRPSSRGYPPRNRRRRDQQMSGDTYGMPPPQNVPRHYNDPTRYSGDFYGGNPQSYSSTPPGAWVKQAPPPPASGWEWWGWR